MKKISTFADRLKAYRDENNTTLKDLEKITGVPAQTLNRYELGQRIPKVDKAGEIAELLGVSSLWLQGYNVPMKPPESNENYMNDDEALEYLDELHKRPEMKALFQVSRKASKEDIETAITIIEALKKKNSTD